jgi:7-carboxy-7-deazaguanine synthase
MSVPDLINRIERLGNRNVTITGGEPFMQEDALHALCTKLIPEGYHISIETNGSYEFLAFDDIDYVVDYKTPSSGESEKMKKYLPWVELKSTDWVKFVIQDYNDYSSAIGRIRFLKSERCLAQFAMSPILTSVSVNNLLDWLKKDCISDVVVSVQLHKLLKLDEVP